MQHFNDNIITPHLNETSRLGCTPTKRLLTTDGCAAQFHNKDQYLWVSRQKQKTGVQLGFVIGAAAHNKDLSDPECGGAKHCVDRQASLYFAEPDQHPPIQTTADVVACLKAHYQPAKSIYEKKGVGIYRRFIHHVPASGPGSIRRGIAKAKPLPGSKKIHQYVDIGEEGKLVRARPCHQHERCMQQDKKYIMEECTNTPFCGQAKIVQVAALTQAIIPVTRNALQNTGSACL